MQVFLHFPCRFLTNTYLREEAPNSHVVEQRVEWQVLILLYVSWYIFFCSALIYQKSDTDWVFVVKAVCIWCALQFFLSDVCYSLRYVHCSVEYMKLNFFTGMILTLTCCGSDTLFSITSLGGSWFHSNSAVKLAFDGGSFLLSLPQLSRLWW